MFDNEDDESVQPESNQPESAESPVAKENKVIEEEKENDKTATKPVTTRRGSVMIPLLKPDRDIAVQIMTRKFGIQRQTMTNDINSPISPSVNTYNMCLFFSLSIFLVG